ncbi:MAG: helix-turn-helix transcriptional regulator [Clostridia bacterium]|nr:helix-turn-helix transcriptional regulator [Clostridia bacterium]
MDYSQLLKGILEGCILSIIAQEETYGYEILNKLEENGFENLGEGTLYPILTRLDNKKLIQCRKAKSPFGPIRKYYSITEAGKESLKSFIESYKKIADSANNTLFKEEK